MHKLFYFFLFLLPVSLLAEPASQNATDYLNQLRLSAGLTTWSINDQLKIAAQNHANYLNHYRQRGHYEQRGKAGFTGKSHVERLVYSGYPSRHADENTSYHSFNSSDKESIDGLMAAIYHRLAFLSFDYDEIGTGITKSDDYSSFVYNMGNSKKRTLCETPFKAKQGEQYYTRTCADLKQGVEINALNNALTNTQLNNPEFIVWPPANSEDIPPAFYEEQPDPLPHHDVSGYPISVQFNPAYFSTGPPLLTNMVIVNANTNKVQETITYLNQKTDPHNKLTAYEHVLFPLKRLEWDTPYQVTMNYQANGQNYNKQWTFRTRKLAVPVIRLDETNRNIAAVPGKKFAVYVPPNGSRDNQSRYNTRYYGQTNIQIKFVDDHTLLITPLNVSGTTTVHFQGQHFKITT